MNTSPIPIDASRAREKFFDILDRVFTSNERFLIRKSGIPVAEIVKPRKKVKKNSIGFKGDWRNNPLVKLSGIIKGASKNLSEDVDSIYLRD